MRRPALRAVAFLIALSGAGMIPAQNLDITRPDVQRFIQAVGERHGLAAETIVSVLQDAVPQQSILETMARPAERTLAWWEYRRRFMTEERIAAGLALWSEHQQVLERIATERGVPPEYLLAITGVETFFGRVMGRHRVLDALATLAFDYPPRSDYFTRELEQYLLLSREEQLDPRLPVGSYAGAMGAPQFMPSSLRNFAVDGDGDGKRDLWQQWPDVFASIANYFAAHGWRAGEPVLADAVLADESAGSVTDDPAAAQLALADSVASLRRRGYRFETTLADGARAMLVPAPQEQSLAWRVGFENFYVITRYNRSPLYAMAVHDLAQALAERRRSLVSTAPTPVAAASP